MTDALASSVANGQTSLSLSTPAARKLANTTKTEPQMQGISPRWLLRVLPWEPVKAGTYRVNRRLTYTIGDGRIGVTAEGGRFRVVPPELCELPLLRGFDDDEVLARLADRFTQREFRPGEAIVAAGQPAEELVLIAHGKVNKIGTGKYGDPMLLGALADGDYVGEGALLTRDARWTFTVRTITPCTVLTLPRREFSELAEQSDRLATQLDRFHARPRLPQNRWGEAAIEVASGHTGEPGLPGTFADYALSPREYELSVAQTVLRVHTRVADLYNRPMNQFEQQLRLTVEALKERQEHEMVNNPGFGLLPCADLRQRIQARTGPPTPDDLDELLSRRRKPRYLLAHPRAIAAFGRECNRRGIYPQTTEVEGRTVHAWRGVPLLPCNKIPITGAGVTSILVMRTGLRSEGVIGLHQPGIPEEIEPSLNVRFMGISEKAIMSYLVSVYFSVAVLVPDALGVLENVETTRAG